MWIYKQSTGELRHNMTPHGIGYAGTGVGRNNPKLQNVANVGPLPRGVYTIEPARDTETHGPMVLALTPDPGNAMCGRAGFLIHGDNRAGDASKGCIILNKVVRDRLGNSPDRVLHVVE